MQIEIEFHPDNGPTKDWMFRVGRIKIKRVR